MKKVTKKQVADAYRELEKAKSAYKQWDEILTAMIESGMTIIQTPEGTFQVNDQFAEKNVVWKPTAMKRYELKKVA